MGHSSSSSASSSTSSSSVTAPSYEKQPPPHHKHLRHQDISKQPTRSVQKTKLSKLLSDGNFEKASLRLQRRPQEAAMWMSCPAMTPATTSAMLPLHAALLQKCPPSFIQHCVDAYPSALTETDSFGMTPLHVACQAGLPLDVIKLLVVSPQCCRVVDGSGRTPLHLACISNALRPDVVCFLLERFPEAVSVRNDRGYLPCECIGPHPHRKRLQLEMERGARYWKAKPAKPGSLAACIRQRNWDTVLRRLRRDDDTDDEDYMVTSEGGDGDSNTSENDDPFFTFENSRNKGSAGRDNDANDQMYYFDRENNGTDDWVLVKGHRQLPLHLACRKRAPLSVIHTLIEANHEALGVRCQPFNMMPLHMACQVGASTATILMLLGSYGAATTFPDEHGLLPLHLACTEGASIAVIKALIEEHPAAARTNDQRGFTPINYALVSRHPHAKQIVELLEAVPLMPRRKPSHEKEANSRSKAMTSASRRKLPMRATAVRMPDEGCVAPKASLRRKESAGLLSPPSASMIPVRN